MASFPETAKKKRRKVSKEKTGEGEAGENQGAVRGGGRQMSAEKRMTWKAKESR